MSPLEGLIVVGLAAAAIFAWSRVIGRLRRGEEPVSYEPRREVPWPGGATLLIVVLYLGLQGAAAGIVNALHGHAAQPLTSDAEAAADPSRLLRVLQAHVAACVLVLSAAAAVLKSTAPQTRPEDVGFGAARLIGDLRLGVAAFFVIVPPVILLQVLLTQLVGESRHPLVEGWKRGGGPELLLWSILGAVVAAPLIEEFLFRGILQGWFERLFTPGNATSSPATQEVAPLVEPAAAVASTPPSWTPIILSSALFALAHIGNGPDPVPIFFLALGLGYLYRQTHRLWPGIVVHFLLNAFSTAVLVLGVET